MAREPIFSAKSRVVGYRLHVAAHSVHDDGDDAIRLGQSLDADGFDALTFGQPAFVRAGLATLLTGLPPLLAPKRTVIELSADMADSRTTRIACERWRGQGYALAIDDFSMGAPAAGLAPLVNYLKIPMGPEPTCDSRSRTVASLKAGGASVIATGVNTLEQWEAAAADGVTGFQGFFFGRPMTAGGRTISTQQLASLRLLRALNESNLSVGQLEDIVKHDASLCYWLLRCINSAAYALPRTVTSVGDALLLLGRDVVKRWASMWAMAGLNTYAHNEVVTTSTVRARVCELLARTGHGDELAGEAFLLGMCSLLDAMLGRPMAEIVAELPLSASLRDALQGQPNTLRSILDTVVAHERGAFAECETLGAVAHVDARMIPGAFLEALRWAREFQAPAAPARA